MKSNPPDKHHYLPKFYLKRWACTDDRLCQFSRPFKGTVVPKRVHPSQTGFIKKLYTLRGFPRNLENQVEQNFFSKVDDQAARTLTQFERNPDAPLTYEQKSSWTRFLLSLLLRMPEDIETFREQSWRLLTTTSEKEYIDSRSDTDPSTLSEYIAQMSDQVFEASIFPSYLEMIDNPKIGNYINEMIWITADLRESKHELFTSDRPVIMTFPIDTKRGHIVLPIGPRRVFIAANSRELAERIYEQDIQEFVAEINRQVITSSVCFAYARRDAGLRYVQKRMGTIHQERLIQLHPFAE